MPELLLQQPTYVQWLAAFAAGWLVTMLAGSLRRQLQSRRRDPRDDRIRTLEAELRIARADNGKVAEAQARLQAELDKANATIDEYATNLNDQEQELSRLKRDLRDSVRLTAELRTELTDRAEENLRSTVRLHQVETELSVARASSELISTGVLDYGVGGNDESDDEPDETAPHLRSVT